MNLLGAKGRTEHRGPASYTSRTVLELATMIRHGRTLVRVLIDDLERRQLRLLRAGLGLDPPPATKQHTGRRKAAGPAGVPGTESARYPGHERAFVRLLAMVGLVVLLAPLITIGGWMLSCQPRGGSQ